MSVIIPSRRHLITRTKMPLLVPGASVNLAHPLAQGLVSWWRVNQVGYGTKIWHSLVNNHYATLTNGIHSNTSGWHNANLPRQHGELRFNGSDDQATIALGTSVYKATGFITIAFWLRCFGAQSGNVGVFSISDTNAGSPSWIHITRNTTTTLNFWLNDAFRFTLPVSDNIDYHIALTYDGSVWRGFLNGVVTASYTGPIGTRSVANTFFGKGFTNYASIAIDDFIVSQEVLPVDILYQSSLLGHPELLIPSRTRYYSFATAAAGSVITCEPSRAQYQAQTPVVTLGVIATPAQAQYQTLAQQLTRSFAANPSQAQYQAQVIQITRGILESPSQAQYQAQTATLGHGIGCTPSQAQYQAQTPVITIGVTEQPSRAQYQATTPVINGATTVVVTQGQAQYQAQTSRLTLGVTEQPSRSQYQAQTPQVSIGLVAGVSRAQTQAQTPQVGRGVTEQPGQAQYQAQTPVVERPITATPSRSQYQAVVPNITMTVVAQPSRSPMQAGTPVLGRTIIVSRGQGQYQAVTPLTGRTALVTPSQSQYRAQTPVAGTETMGEVNVTPSRAQYQANTPIAAIETPAVYYSKQADGVGLAIQTLHPAVRLRL